MDRAVPRVLRLHLTRGQRCSLSLVMLVMLDDRLQTPEVFLNNWLIICPDSTPDGARLVGPMFNL